MGRAIVAGPQLRAAVVAAVCAAALAACGGGGGGSPERLADDTTRAVYANDGDKAVASFDDSLKGKVTRGQIGALSDVMHRYGDYKGLKLANSVPDQGRYDYEADFDKGAMLVQMRLDPSGRIGAFRITAVQ